MGKTTAVIGDKLLEIAIKVTEAKSKREAIEEGLKELVRRKNIEPLRKELGTCDLDLTLARLERLREEE